MIRTFYLAGGMQSDWREAASIYSAHTFIDPRKLNEGVTDPAIYTERDLAAIRQCDGVLAFMSPDNPSGYGLSVEVGYAAALDKPIAWVDTLGDDWRARYFGMHRHMGHVCPDFYAAVFWLVQQTAQPHSHTKDKS